MATPKVTPWAQSDAARTSDEELGVAPEDQGVLFCVTLEPLTETRRIPPGLVSHRRKLDKAGSRSDAVRARIGRMPMAEVQTHHMDGFIKALREEGKKPATVQLERAVLRGLFNHARTCWHWGLPRTNPAVGLKMTYVDMLVLDELGYLPFSQAGGALLFHLLSKLYEHTSVVITTNLSFGEWDAGRLGAVAAGPATQLRRRDREEAGHASPGSCLAQASAGQYPTLSLPPQSCRSARRTRASVTTDWFERRASSPWRDAVHKPG